MKKIEKYLGKHAIVDLLREVQVPGLYLPPMHVSIPIDELLLMEALTLPAGLRYDDYKQDQTAIVNSANTRTQSNSALSPKIGLTTAFPMPLTSSPATTAGSKALPECLPQQPAKAWILNRSGHITSKYGRRD
jgi:hypothetical protein